MQTPVAASTRASARRYLPILAIAGSILASACGGTTAPASASVDAGGGANDGEAVGQKTSGLQYEGSIVTETTATGARVEISAPLFPNSIVFQQFQSPKAYPTLGAADRERLVDEEVKSFDELLPLCAPMYPEIVLRGPSDPPLSLDQLRTNYGAVARCAYDHFGAKPYWVPRLLDDLDVCGRKLGADWHLPTEGEIGTMSTADFTLFQETLTALPGTDWFPVQLYYRLQIYARGTDGALVLGDLAPDAPHVSPLPIPGDALDTLYIGNGDVIGVRCLRALP